MNWDEVLDRLDRAEARIRELQKAIDDELEERYRLTGQLHLALAEVREAQRRFEEWRETTDDSVREVRVTMRAAGSVFMLPNRTN